MAKFSGKNIEFKDGQKAIFGTEDDSAIYWDDAAEHLIFTTVVSGVDPTADGHLITRRYLEDILLGTTESGTQIGNLLFGSEFGYIVSESESSTNSTTLQQKLSLTTSDIPEGSYRIAWSYDWRISKNNNGFNIRVQLDNTVDFVNTTLYSYNDVTIWNPRIDFYYLSTLSSGTHTIDIDFCSSSTSATAYIKEARIEFWRVT